MCDVVAFSGTPASCSIMAGRCCHKHSKSLKEQVGKYPFSELCGIQNILLGAETSAKVAGVHWWYR